jgi:hypothetical protein
MSTLRADNFGPSAGGTTRSLRGIAAAWANLNGTGTIALRDSLNVSSVVDNNTGDYTYQWTASVANRNFAAHLTTQINVAASGNIVAGFRTNGAVSSTDITTYGAAGLRVAHLSNGGTANDMTVTTMSVMGDLA